jgi:hypothetical protein
LGDGRLHRGAGLRAFIFGHVRQPDRICGELLARVWAGTPAGGGPRTVDLDSTICAVCDIQRQGACDGYTCRLGYR